MPEQTRLIRGLSFLLLAIVFGISYSQYPLFYHTQNQYFFQGLARTGFGQLGSDWFARTPDPWPAFTALVEVTYRFLDHRFFYLYFVLLLGVYALSMIGIVSRLFRLDKSRSLIFLVLMIALHSAVFGYLSRTALGLPMASSPHHFNIGRILLLEGVGEKRILGDMLNPGTFGVFLLLSIYLFLLGRPFLAVVSSSVAAVFQPSYVLYCGILTLSYMGIMVKRGDGLKRPLGLGLAALALIAPLLAYSYIAFRPTDPAIWRESQAILWRLAYYPPAVPALWMGATVYLKIVLVLVALYVIRRTELFWILLVSFAAAAGLTYAQMVTNNNALAALLPWRISAFVVPIAALVLVGYGVARLPDRYVPGPRTGRNALVAASVVALVVLSVAGALETKRRFDEMSEKRMPGAMRFVRATKAPGQTYLIPPNWRTFRLFTGAPVFVEKSVIPYNDVGVMEWYKRVRLAEAFYGIVEADRQDDYRYQDPRRRSGRAFSSRPGNPAPEPSKEERCHTLKELSAAYGVTHVVFKGDALEGCPGWKVIFSEGGYRLYTMAN